MSRGEEPRAGLCEDIPPLASFLFFRILLITRASSKSFLTGTTNDCVRWDPPPFANWIANSPVLEPECVACMPPPGGVAEWSPASVPLFRG
jgi:hypothetical protein